MAESKKNKKLKVEFIESPTGLFALAYNVGDVESFDEKQAKEMIEAKVAKLVK